MILRGLFAALLLIAGLGPVTSQGSTPAIDCSGAITVGGTAQFAFQQSGALTGFTIANIDTAEVMWISFTGPAVPGASGSYPLPPATATTFAGVASFTAPPSFRPDTGLSVVAATTGHKWSCTRW